MCIRDSLCTGRHTFTFLMAPMVHWPEVMVTYDAADKVLFLSLIHISWLRRFAPEVLPAKLV